MDWLTFISTMTGHVMWPLVIITLLVLVRKHIGALADRIEEFSFGGAKFIWKKSLQEGKAIIELLPLQPEVLPAGEPGQHPEPSEVKDRTRLPTRTEPTVNPSRNSLWHITTVGTIITKYQELEALLLEIGDALGIDAAHGHTIMYVLIDKGLVGEEIATLYSSLRTGRNTVVHDNAHPSTEDAREYARQAERFKTELLSIKDEILRDEGRMKGKESSRGRGARKS